MSAAERERRLQALLEELGVIYDAEAPARLNRYHEMLCDWNTRMNLTGDTDFEVALTRHYADSLAPLRLDGLFQKEAAIVDVGSGAGFPGLPLAIVRPDLRVTLLDSLGKRVAFLDAVVKELGLGNAWTVRMRAEDAGQDARYRERYDMAVARAVAALPVLCELLLPLVKPGGTMACYKGPAAGEEQEAGNRAAALLGGGRLRMLPVTLADRPDWQHTLCVSQKKEKTLRQYPRKAGTPGRLPLGGFGKT